MSTKTFKPMLSGKAPADLEQLRYPLLASPKLDGIRCIIVNGKAMSRSLKPIPNEHIQAMLADCPDGLDGELMTEGGYNAVQSAVMSKDGEPEFRFCVFDTIGWEADDAGFNDRLESLRCWLDNEHLAGNQKHVQLVPHVMIHTSEELRCLEIDYLNAGFEGVMVRDPAGPYKFGRSTTKQGWLLKIKQFADEEAVVIDCIEQMHNGNELEQDELGHAKRSHKKDGKVPAGTLGALICRTEDGAEFGIGTGFDAAQRLELWQCHISGGNWPVVGQLVKFKHLPDPGGRKPGQAPRHPVFLGFRSKEDLS
jgi:DNA ligase-1